MTQTTGFVEVHRSSLRDQVARAIRAAIFSGELRPGDRINESQIAERMKVSKAPVREALRLLESASLVSTIPNRGCFVAKLTSQDVRDVFGVRSAAEHLAVSLVIDSRDTAVLEEMQSAVDCMREAERRSDIEAVSRADVAFHESLIAHSGNQRLVRMWKELEQLMAILRHQENVHAMRISGADGHEAILRTIREGDKVRAQSQMEQHIMEACVALAGLMDR